MKTSFKFLLIALVTANVSYSQNVAINTTGSAANLSSMLDVSSGASGTLGLLIPRMTNAQRTGIVTLPAAAQGLVVYQTNAVGSSLEGFYYNTSTTTTPAWSYLTSGGWLLAGNGGTTSSSSGIGTPINNNFLGTTDAIDLAFGTNGYERMRIKSDAAGNSIRIGIGTAFTTNLNTGTTPSLFHLHSPSDIAELNLTTGTTASGNRAAVINFAATSVVNERRTASIESYLTNYTNPNATGDLRFFTNNANSYTEKMRIQGDGLVGIGTTAPAYRLDLGNGTFGFGNSNQRTETRDNAGLQGNAGAQSGFFETSAPVNYPAGASSWWHLIDSRHSNVGNNYALQIAGSFFDQNLYFRKTNGAGNTAWSQILTTASANTGYIQNQFAGAQIANHWVSGSSRATEAYAVNWFRVDGGGGIYWESYGGGWYMQDATWIRGYNGRSLWMGSGLIGGDGGLTIGYGGAGSPAGGGIIAGNVGIGINPPICKLHVQADGDNTPVVFGKNINATAGTTSYGVRGECGSTGLGSAGVSGVSTNSSQNEIGVVGDYSLWGAGVFGLGWAAAYTDMPSSRDFGVFGTVNYSTGTGVYGRNTNTTVGSAYGMYCNGNFAVTGAKSATIPTSQGNQLVYSMESPEVWFEDAGRGQLVNGSLHITLSDLFQEAIFADDQHPFMIFTQEMGESQGLIVITDSDWKGFTVKEKNNGTSQIAFSYRIMAKRRFYQDVKFGVDANQPFANNLKDAKYIEPATQDPNVMMQQVAQATAQKEAEYKKTQEQGTNKKTTSSSSVAGENKLDAKTPRPEDPVQITKPAVNEAEKNSNPIENPNTVTPK